MNNVAIWGSLLAGAWASGCAGHPADIACDERGSTPHVCVLYSAVAADEQGDLKSTCTNAMGTVGASCPSSNALGTCTLTAGGEHKVQTYYSDGGTTADMASAACEAFGGTWKSK